MATNVLEDRYEIQRQLGARAGQQTLLALDRQTQDLVVLKLLTFSSDLGWETFKLFEREAKTLQELTHPAVPRYLGYFDVETASGKGFVLVQSYIDAPSLAEHIQAGRTFDETNLKQIAKAVLKVLIHLHHRYPPIIHRDIKPSNILLTRRFEHPEGQVYLVDFGSVQAAACEKETITVVGTYGYMPPEQFGGRAVPASDLYGLGATLIALASGQHPADLPQKDLRICFEGYVSFSPAFSDWLQWMTEPSLDRRLKSADQALQALEKQQLRQNLSLVTVKPADSKVLLTRKSNSLEICIPAKGFTIDLLPMIGFALIWNGFLVFWYYLAIQTWSSGGGFAAFFALGHLGVGLWLILQILFALFGQIWLQLDHEQVALRYQLFNLKYPRSRSSLRRQISKLERTQTYFKRTRTGDQKVKPQLNIWAGTKKIRIGGSGLLSEAELDWLAYELSNWLELPISGASAAQGRQ